MKILMMTNTYLPIVGGLEKSIQGFSEEFRARGHEVKIVAPEFKKKPAQEKDVIRVPALEKFVGTDFSVGLPLPEILQKFIEEFKPDIVHSHHPFLMGDLALRVCGQYKIPLVFTYHTMFEHYRDHFAMDKQAVQQFVVELATGYANMADQIIAPSESVAQVLTERKIQRPIAIVPTGIDVQRFAPAATDFRKKNKIPQGVFLLGHTGRLAPEKNLIFLTEAVATFLENKKNAHFLIIGSGPCERDMRKIFLFRNVHKRVHFAGILKGKALVDAYHAMDVFVFASKSETQGMVITEAMAAGLPVVALDAPGVREVVQDKANGRLLGIESLKRFAAALLWCSSRSPGQWNKIKKNALDTANQFSSKVCSEKALKIYEAVRRRYVQPQEASWNQWNAFVGRFKTELEMLLNLGRAAGSAVKSAVTESSPKDKIEELYRKKAKEALESWMHSLKEIRKNIQNADGSEKERLESSAAAIVEKIHTCERELEELGRKVLYACETLDQYIAEMQGAVQGVLEQQHRILSNENVTDAAK